jgi:hypothetical protein
MIMKNLLYILLFVPLALFGQMNTKLLIDSNKTSLIQNEIISNLDNHHRQFNNGMYLQGGGVLLTIVSSLIKKPKAKNTIYVTGLSLNLVGVINIIDSQKWFSKSNYLKFYPGNELDINKNGRITFKDFKEIYNVGDIVNVKTLNGPVILSGELVKITYQYIELQADNQKFMFHYNIIESVSFNNFNSN